MNEQRECGGCTACCTVNGIIELGKPIYTHCQHECATGCAIYNKRPQSCRNFMCAWIRGFGEDEERPDKLGLFIEERPGPPDGRQFFVKELRPGAASTKEALDYFNRLITASKLPVYIFDHTLTQLIGKVEVKPMDREKWRKQRKKKKR